jgi:hypothetical protein
MFETTKPNPQLVADAIVELINMPNGKRPLRTVVDPTTGNFSEVANKHVKEQYDNFLTSIWHARNVELIFKQYTCYIKFSKQ